jgi:hypothetical protein
MITTLAKEKIFTLNTVKLKRVIIILLTEGKDCIINCLITLNQ